MELSKIRSAILGHAIGDALGVPVEFKNREKLIKDPVTDMRSFGTYNQPAGSWSDDTSMTLCLMESLARLNKVDYEDIMKNFVRWCEKGEFTPQGVRFDIGIATGGAIHRYHLHKVAPLECGGTDEYSNGNGSLMRIIPIILYLYDKGADLQKSLDTVHKVSMLTHAHPRTLIGCGIYTFIIFNVLDGHDLLNSVKSSVNYLKGVYEKEPDFNKELVHYERLFDADKFKTLREWQIKSGGYVVSALEASVWSLLNSKSYEEAVLKAVNLGDDTDTTGAITGGLAGIYYGVESIPQKWINALINLELIEDLCKKFANTLRACLKNIF